MHPTENFLSLIWPSEGNKCIVTIKDKIVKHYWFAAARDAASHALDMASQGLDVYHSLASFTGSERKADQVQTLRAIWLDIDCGDGKEYANQRVACAALKDFVDAAGLPFPLIVSSGYGLHVYWILKEAIERAEWQRLSDRLRTLCLFFGLRADHKCTCDAARILRPIGTSNYKNGNPQRVHILNRPGAPIALDDTAIAIALGNGNAVRSDAGQAIDWTAQPALNGGTPIANPFTIFTLPPLIAQGGRNDTLFKFGSSLRAKGMDDVELRRQLHIANQNICKPPLDVAEVDIIAASCAKFPPGQSKITQVNGVLKFDHARLRVLPTPAGCQIHTPHGRGDKTEWRWDKVADYGLRPVMELLLEHRDGALQNYMWMETYDHQGKPHDDFVIPSTSFSSAATLSHECSKQGFITDIEEHPSAYKTQSDIVREWVRAIQRQQGNAYVFKSFGWMGPDNGSEKTSFLLGNIMYRSDGPHAAPRIPGKLQYYQTDMGTRGTLEAWTAAMDNYNLPGMEAYMFASWTMWAAPLMVFTESQNIVFHLVGLTGVGKSSLQRSIVSAYGDYSSKTLVDVNASTMNSVGGVMGIFNAIPYCKEEATEIPPGELASWALTVTQGREKGRMNQNRDIDNPRTWNTIAVTSANTSLRDVVRNQSMDHAARLARIWEQDMALPMDTLTALQLFAPLKKNYGHAAPIYIDYVVRNRDHVKTLVSETEDQLFTLLKARGPERFNISLLAAAFVGATIANQLGLIHHDFVRGRNYAIAQYNLIRKAVKAEVHTSEQVLSAFLQEQLPGTIVVEYDHPSLTASVFDTADNIIKDVPTGMSMIARFAKKEARLYIVSSILRRWYAEKRLNFDNDMNRLRADGILTDENKKMTLTKGTARADGMQFRCHWFDLSKSTELVEKLGVV